MPAMVLLHHTFESQGGGAKPLMGVHGPLPRAGGAGGGAGLAGGAGSVQPGRSTAIDQRVDHYDWLMPWREQTVTAASDERSLLAFRVRERIDDARVTEFLAQLLPPHRRHYLLFEGEISKEKGRIERVARGQFTKLEVQPSRKLKPEELLTSPSLVMVSVRGYWPAWPMRQESCGEYTWAGWPLDSAQSKGLPEGEPWWYFKRSTPHRMIKPPARWRDDDRLADYVKMASRL